MKLRIAGTVGDSIVDGPGLRLTVFVQGCPHHCPGCHNPHTHDFEGGHDTTVEELFAAYCENPLLRGVTLSGGEPFCQPAPLAQLAHLVHAHGGDVFCYTGYTYEQLCEKQDPAVDALLGAIEVLVDGPFLLAERDLTLRFRGSTNQRMIDIPRTRETGEIVLWE